MVWLTLILVGSLASCGPDNGLALAKVEGSVTYKGRPLATGEIAFLPDHFKGTIGPPARGTIGRGGTYILSTEFAGDGALVGFHRVSLTGLEPVPSLTTGHIGRSKGHIGRRTRSPRKARASPWQVTLPKSPTSWGSSRYRIVTPKRLQSPSTSGLVVEVRQGSNKLNFDIQEAGAVSVRP